jgi:hypothetical protein
MIIDGYDDITKGLINYQIYDSSCTVLLGTILKFGPGAGLEEATIDVRFENPVTHEFVLLGETEFTSIQVSDLSGKSMVITTSGSNRFDVSSLPAGFYVLNAVNDQLVRRSFVKM